ncbi:MAG: hypothetical protein V1875_06550 [Candidatus Altiarchaeota archaeon]
MDVSGLCDICGKVAAGFTCSLCGKRVCPDHITVRGICSMCAGDNVKYDRNLVDKVLLEKGLNEVLK